MARRRWQLTLSNLVDAIVAVSIEAGALEFPADHPFWGTFTLVQDREIAQALASLGHRFDGLGGFADDRVPSQRDLSLALGYAGLDPMRMRSWPTETEMAELYRDVSVAADEHLAATAGDLSLSELVAMLGRRADGLADLWNEWGRRPAAPPRGRLSRSARAFVLVVVDDDQAQGLGRVDADRPRLPRRPTRGCASRARPGR